MNMGTIIKMLGLILICSPFAACVTTSVPEPSLGGVTSAIGVIGSRVTDAQLNAKDVAKLADLAYQRGLAAKSAEASAIRNKVQELQRNLQAAKQAEQAAYQAKDRAQVEIAKVTKQAEKVPKLETALAKATKWHFIFGVGFGLFALAGVVAAKVFSSYPAISWLFKIPLLGDFAELGGLLIGGLAGILAAFVVASVLVSIWSGFGWFLKLFV